MAGFTENVRRLFPIKRIEDVVAFFKMQLENASGPNLALLSILVGYIENQLTCNRIPGAQHAETTDEDLDMGHDANVTEVAFPVVELKTIEALYNKFESQIKGSVDLSQFRGLRSASRELVKKASDVIWSTLTRSYYKDRAHLQSLYSYLTGNKLDCFGVAFAVVVACQVLRYNDVHLALSEDHAWVTFGKDGEETAEVTWHGKGNEDKRGQPVTTSSTDKSWLYLNGHPVRCSRFTEVAALVSGINPSINATTDSFELAALQQQLLWLLYDKGHLRNYPMALGNLGDLEEINPTPGRPPPLELFKESIVSAQTNYDDHHVYPYTYFGGFFYRNGRYKEALGAWAAAADVIRKFNYSREDEEIYKEFLEIANELIPHIIKVVSAGGCEPSGLSSVPLLQDPNCFASLLKFYDGLCAWEEESSTPVLHIGWARPLVATISKFLSFVRALVVIHIPDENEIPSANPEECSAETEGDKDKNANHHSTDLNQSTPPVAKKPTEEITNVEPTTNGSANKAMRGKTKQAEIIQSLVTGFDSSEAPHPKIATLAAGCGENIFNPEYLLGSGEPFTSSDSRELMSAHTGNRIVFPSDSVLEKKEQLEMVDKNEDNKGKVRVTLSSRKMAGLRELLTAEKLNTSAIQLQLTAQSQVHMVKRGRSATAASATNEYDFSSVLVRGSKRARRE